MTDGEKIILAIQSAAIAAAVNTWMNTPITTGIAEKIEMAIAAYETALICPIADAPKDGTAILTIDTGTCRIWYEDRWDSEFEDWDICPDSTPTHFRPIPYAPKFAETPDAA